MFIIGLLEVGIIKALTIYRASRGIFHFSYAKRFSFILKWQFHSKSLEKLSMNTERKIFHTITNIHCMAKVKNYHDPGECQTNEENIIGKLQVSRLMNYSIRQH